MAQLATLAFGPLFALGQVVATVPALALLDRAEESPDSFLARHHAGDWGDLSPNDAEANVHALQRGGRLLSSYPVAGEELWIITEADRSVTTLLLPHDY